MIIYQIVIMWLCEPQMGVKDILSFEYEYDRDMAYAQIVHKLIYGDDSSFTLVNNNDRESEFYGKGGIDYRISKCDEVAIKIFDINTFNL